MNIKLGSVLTFANFLLCLTLSAVAGNNHIKPWNEDFSISDILSEILPNVMHVWDTMLCEVMVTNYW